MNERMKRMRARRESMPIVAMVGLCFSLLALAATIVVASSVGLWWALLGLGLSLGATAVFGGVLAAWVLA